MSASRSPWVYVNPGKVLDGIPLQAYQDIFGWRGYVSDFVYYEGPVAEGTDGGIILSNAAGTATITRVTATGRTTNGVIRLTVSTTEDDHATLEFPLRFIYEAGKQMVVFARFAISDADDMEAFFGLATPGDTDWVASLGVEGIFFEKAETAVDFDFHVRDNSTSTEDTTFSGTTLFADDTFIIVGFRVLESGVIIPYYGTDINSMTAGTSVSASDANLPNDVGDELSLYFAIEGGSTDADYMDIDWVVALMER